MQDKLEGVVTRFKGNGRKFGYPTANLTTKTDLKDGVYFGYADLKDFKDHPSLIFVGTPTTVGDTERRVAVHLLDIPDVDYYDEVLALSPRHLHRQNETFSGVDELLEIMRNDEVRARAWFDNERTA